jgi:hypothetical protein
LVFLFRSLKRRKADRRQVCLFRKKGRLIAAEFSFYRNTDRRRVYPSYSVEKVDRRRICLFYKLKKGRNLEAFREDPTIPGVKIESFPVKPLLLFV